MSTSNFGLKRTITSNMTAVTEVRSASFGLVLHAQYIFANSFNFLRIIGYNFPYEVHILCMHGMALYWPRVQFYLCVYISFVCRYVAPPGECYYNTLLCCEDYFSSSRVVSRAFSALSVYSKFEHHPHPLS